MVVVVAEGAAEGAVHVVCVAVVATAAAAVH